MSNLRQDVSEKLPSEPIREQLDRILRSTAFRDAQRSSRLLRFLVEETLAGRGLALKEFTLGADALDRGPSFDPRTDPIARVEASRLRTRLELYYSKEGLNDPLRIVLPRGGYVPQFQSAPSASATEPRRLSALNAAVFGALAGIAVAVGVGVLLKDRVGGGAPPGLRQSMQLEVSLGMDGLSIGSEVGPDMALTPDAAELVFVGRESDGGTRLFARSLRTLTTRELPGTFGARGPFVSPDGNWVAYWAAGVLRKARIDGTGSPTTVCDASDLLGGTWADDGSIIAALSTTELSRIDPISGRRTVLLQDPSMSSRLLWPQALRGGEAVVFTHILGPVSGSTIEVFKPGTGERRVLVRGGFYGRYISSGHLIYSSRGTVFAVKLDLQELRVQGAAVPVLREVAYSPTFGNAQIDVAIDGTAVYRRAVAGSDFQLAWVDVTGKSHGLSDHTGPYLWLRLSPDGGRIAFTLQESDHYDLWIQNIQDASRKRLAEGDRHDISSPVWTSDGKYLLYGTRDGIDRVEVDGSRSGRLLSRSEQTAVVPWSISSDGRRLAYYQMGTNTGFDLWTAPIEVSVSGVRSGGPQVFRQTRAFEVYPAFSPDGHWLAYGSNESGNWEVYVRAYPDNGTQVQISGGDGRIPTWSRAGHELLYETDSHRIMAVHYSVEHGTFSPGPPRPWTPIQLGDTGVIANYDLRSDGKSLVALMPSVRTPLIANQFILVTNFSDEVRRRLAESAAPKSTNQPLSHEGP
jgi:eukaryotic-like serine/threonine-protein kinase